ncbi:hypothetical protein [Mucilaginibacter sp. AK015]|uniref:hypothetical protein n=1 Tax=Mucilaginibacter sp. AK015 TaxID=2723072 RepID=UPI001607306C|nr:hypothetical protein [Mucilaginibacter sp. AK015]MBB5396551.1 hypothetical protein [Mucilaginibacter sp. AK015]
MPDADLIWRIFTPIATLFGGIAIERFKNRTIVLEKTVNFQRIAFAANDNDFGSIEITYNGGPSQNLYSGYIEIENNSSKSIKDFILDISVDEGFFIYKDKGLLIQRELTKTLFNTTEYITRRENVFSNMENENKPDDYNDDLDYIVRHRQYIIPVLNSKSRIGVNLLIDGAHNLNMINVGVFEENVDLIFKIDNETMQKNRKAIIAILAGVVFILSAFPTITYAPTIKIAVWIVVINSVTCYLVAWAIYLLFVFFRSFFKR